MPHEIAFRCRPDARGREPPRAGRLLRATAVPWLYHACTRTITTTRKTVNASDIPKSWQVDLPEAGEVVAVTNELTVAEVAAKPSEEERAELARLYEEMVVPSAWLRSCRSSARSWWTRRGLGPELGLKLPDTIHVASAAASGCDVFLSDDHRLKVPDGITLAGLV